MLHIDLVIVQLNMQMITPDTAVAITSVYETNNNKGISNRLPHACSTIQR